MRKFLIVDLESTCCDRGTIDKKDMEIIEIGAVLVERDQLQIIDEFQTFIKPTKNPILTDFCKELTSITQKDIDSAPIFPIAIAEFKNWLYKSKRSFPQRRG